MHILAATMTTVSLPCRRRDRGGEEVGGKMGGARQASRIEDAGWGMVIGGAVRHS